MKVILGFAMVVILGSCASTLPLSKQFYNTKKVGVIIQVDSIGIAKTGSQGLLDMALTPGNRYKEPLQAIEAKVNPGLLLNTEVSNILKSKNKDFIIIPENIINQNLVKFDAPESSEKKFFKRDIRAIKAQYNVDEVLFLKAKYGVLVSYYSMIETGRQGYINLSTHIIDLNDNSLLLQNTINSVANISGKWNQEPEYTNLANAIQDAINKSVITLRSKF